MSIFKYENGTIQVEFGDGETIPLVLGLNSEDGRVIPAMVIMPMHEAMTLNDPKAPKKSFTDFDVRMIFSNLAQVEFMKMQLAEAERILKLSEPSSEEEDVENISENDEEGKVAFDTL